MRMAKSSVSSGSSVPKMVSSTISDSPDAKRITVTRCCAVVAGAQGFSAQSIPKPRSNESNAWIDVLYRSYMTLSRRHLRTHRRIASGSFRSTWRSASVARRSWLHSSQPSDHSDQSLSESSFLSESWWISSPWNKIW